MDYRLYVGQDPTDPSKFCKGSALCMSIIEANPALEKIIRIENLNTILSNGIKVPRWLDGTPTLVVVKTNKIYRGISARDTLLEISPPVPENPRNTQKPFGLPVQKPSHELTKFSSANENDDVVNSTLDTIDWDPADGSLKESKGKIDPKDVERLMKERTARTDQLAGQTKN